MKDREQRITAIKKIINCTQHMTEVERIMAMTFFVSAKDLEDIAQQIEEAMKEDR